MSPAHRLTHVEDVHGFIKRVCFKTGPPGAVGLESEWFVVDPTEPLHHVEVARTEAALGRADLPHRSPLTYEPGGQLELSGLVAPDLSTACRALADDLAVVRRSLASAGLRLLGQGTDPLRPPTVQHLGPRYAAMQRFFDRRNTSGAAMMASTAAIQVCLDAGGDDGDVARRWQLTNALLPVLLATFANSPFRSGRPTGWRSSRYAIWSAIDPSRTAAPPGGDPVSAWTEYALQASVMLLRTADDDWVSDPGCTFADWVSGRSGLEPPTEDDLAYHLTTLFPPVRPRGWLELRYLDQLPEALWPVAVAVTTALIEDDRAADAARAAADSVAGLAPVAMKAAVSDPRLQQAALACLDAAADALPRLGAADLAVEVHRFRERYTARGRCPADDLLDGRLEWPDGLPATADHRSTTLISGRHP